MWETSLSLHNIKVQDEAASAELDAVVSFSEDPAKVTKEGGYTKQRIFSAYKIGSVLGEVAIWDFYS